MQIKEKYLTTQQTALFYSSAELSRRGFTVSILDENLIYCIKDSKSFYIKVSGQKFKKSWIVDTSGSVKPDIYIFVYISPELYEPPEFFILTEKEIKREIKQKKLNSPEEFLKKGLTALSFSKILKYADRWTVFEEKEKR